MKDKLRYINKFLKKTEGYTWTRFKRNEEILRESNVKPIMDKLLVYKTTR